MQAQYPFSRDLHEVSTGFSNGNFGLWFNKFVPVNISEGGDFKVCVLKNKESPAIPFYRNQFDDMVPRNSRLKEMLNQKHFHQIRYGEVVSQQYEKLILVAELVTPLVVGIGEDHPSETALVFEHSLGIPFIPASSVKGVVRFAHSLGLLENEDGEFSDHYVIKESTNEGTREILDEANPDTGIPLMFGGDLREDDETQIRKRRGGIIFMDAYPMELPKIRVDVMTPHYPDYYSDMSEKAETPPADNQNPNPIQFLCVQEGTRFAFRMLVEKDLWESVHDRLLDALKRAVIGEGIGAKTSAGYGRFEVKAENEPDDLLKQYNKWLGGQLSPGDIRKLQLEMFMRRVAKLKKEDQAGIDALFSEWQKDENLRDSREIAALFSKVVRRKKANGDYTKQYSIVRDLIGHEDTGDEAANREKETETTAPRKLSGKEQAIVAKMRKYVEKGSISKKELKKMKQFRNLAPDVYEQLQNLPRN